MHQKEGHVSSTRPKCRRNRNSPGEGKRSQQENEACYNRQKPSVDNADERERVVDGS